MKYNNVLIEIEDTDKIETVELSPYPVLLNHSSKIEDNIGRALVRKENGRIYADIETDRVIGGLYPSVGIQIFERERLTGSYFPGKWSKGKLLAVGVTEIENQDDRIPPIGEPENE